MTTTEENAYEGAFAHRDLPDGRVLVLYEMIYNVRLCIGPQGSEGYDTGWCYDKSDFREAMDVLGTWDGKGTPPGPVKKEVGSSNG